MFNREVCAYLMKRIGGLYLLFIIPSCANSSITSVVNREDSLHKVETISTILASIRTDFLDWKINDYIVAKEAISFRQYEYLLKERLKDKIEFELLPIEEIRNPRTEPFDNDLSSNKKSKFHIVFSTIYQGF